MFTISDIINKGFKETASSYGTWSYTRSYDDVPKEIQQDYNTGCFHYINFMPYDGKEYSLLDKDEKEHIRFRVAEKLYNKIFEKKYVSMCVHVRKNNIVEYIRFGSCLHDSDYFEVSDCQKLPLIMFLKCLN